MTKDEAKPLVIREWDSWATEHLQPDQEGRGTDGLAFFVNLQSERPDLLMFEATGDRWQTVHGWLLQEGKMWD